MKVIFLGLLFCDKSLQEALKNSKVGVQYAPHKFQTNLIDGLKQFPDIDLSVLNVPPTGSFPINSKQLISGKQLWGDNAKQVSFINLPIIKHIIQAIKLYKECVKIIKDKDEKVRIVLYSPHKPFVKVCQKLKKRYKNMDLCLILTDPIKGKGDLKRQMSRRAERLGDKLIEKLKIIDSFVVLTEYLAEVVDVNGRPSTVIECICDKNQKISKTCSCDKKIALYTGTLEREYGILDMARAFSTIPDAEFWIYGSGEASEELIKTKTI